MIPGHFVTAPAIPTLPNGKTDRKALMKLRPAALFPQGFNPGGENETEKQIRTIWRELLGHEAFGSNDSFFEVGGHSLLLVRMKDMILSSIQTDVSIVDLFRFPTIRGLAAFLRKEKPAHDHADIVRRVAMRNKNIREQLGKRMFPGNKPN
jgi:hypothetical protein